MQNKKKQSILFVHQNFPGQFKHLAAACVKKGDEVVAIGHHANPIPSGVNHLRYPRPQIQRTGLHPWLADLETKFARAYATRELALKLRQQGFSPDVIVAHPGWGEATFLKQVWPTARLGLYAEFFYRAQGADVGFDPEFASVDRDDASRLLMKNASNYLQFPNAEAYLCPTQWQAQTFPVEWQPRLSVIHEGVDTHALRPTQAKAVVLPNGRKINHAQKVVTFVARNLEPYRGYHIFMRALPQLQAAVPDAEILIVGGDGTSYGSPASAGTTWKEKFWNEVKDSLNQDKVHFLGHLPYEQYLAVLNISSVHVYLTYPFVLSWSLLEAMSLGKAIVASDTPPVKEVLTHDKEGLLVPFFDTQALSQSIARLLSSDSERQRLGSAARNRMVSTYDRDTLCIPQQLAWIDKLLHLPLRNT